MKPFFAIQRYFAKEQVFRYVSFAARSDGKKGFKYDTEAAARKDFKQRVKIEDGSLDTYQIVKVIPT